MQDRRGGQDWLGDLYCEVYATGRDPKRASARDAQLARTIDRFAESDGSLATFGAGRATDAQAVVNLWSASNPTGLRAFATEFVVRVKERQHAGIAAAPLIYVPLSRVMTPECRADRRWVLDRLAQALQVSSSQPDPLAEDAYDAWESKLVERLRLALCSAGALVIFGGLEAGSEPFGTLIDVLKNADWCTLLKQLIQPAVALEFADASKAVPPGRRSRFLVLSNRALRELRAWMPCEPEKLEPVPSAGDVRDLLFGTPAAVSARAQLTARVSLLWAAGECGPHWQAHSYGLKDVYRADDETLAWLHLDAATMPAELDLTLAAWVQRTNATAESLALEGISGARRNLKMFQWCMASIENPAARLALEFIALAVNGLRISTLRRCLGEYAAATDDEHVKTAIGEFVQNDLATRASVQSFVEPYCLVLVLTTDEEPNSALSGRRWFELQANSDDHLKREDKSTSGVLLDLRFEELRELFWARMLAAAGDQEGVKRFALTNRILAEEAIAQATGQLRLLPLETHTSVYALRRLLQTIFHGLLSLRLQRPGKPTSDVIDPYGRSAVRATAIPRNDQKAYAYLYEFVFRRCIEDAPRWTLGRGAGRNDIRFTLMMLFADPEWCRELLGQLHARTTEARGFDSWLAKERIEHFFDQHVSRVVEGSTLLPTLAQDMHVAMLQSAKRHPGMLQWLAKHAESAAATSSPALDKGAERWRHQMRKFEIDALEATLSLTEARARSVKLLSLMVPGLPHQLDKLGSLFKKANWSKAAFEAELAKVADAILQEQGKRGSVVCRETSDLLYRLGEVLAAAADERDYSKATDAGAGVLAMGRGLEAYADGYAAFWVADRLRASSAFVSDASVDWPVLSAKAVRYFVRTSLKLSKLLSRSGRDEIANEQLRDHLFQQSNEFYVLGRGRVDTYSRHLFRAPAERLSMLMLMASAARVRSTIFIRRTEVTFVNKREAYAEVSLQYLADAEYLWCQLGCIPSIAKRLLLERIKTLRRLRQLDGGVSSPLAVRYAAAARNDLVVLRQLSNGNKFWSGIVDKLERRSRV